MGAAGVNNKLEDLSTRVPSFPGVYGGIVIDAKKGPVNTPFLVTNETQFLKNFTPDETVDVGFSLGYYSALAFLQKSSTLWVVRAVNNALYSSLKVRQNGSSKRNETLTDGLKDPTSYDLSTNNGRQILEPSTFKMDTEADPVFGTCEVVFYELSLTGDKVKFLGGAPTPLLEGTEYFLIKGPKTGQIAFASTKSEALEGTALGITEDFTSTKLVLSNIETVSEEQKESSTVMIHSANEGEWGNRVFVEVHPYRSTETVEFKNGSIKVGQSWEVGEAVRFYSTGKLPDGISSELNYFVTNIQEGAVSVSETYEKALKGEAVQILDGTDTGTHTLLPTVEYTKEEGTFAILVFKKSNLSNPVESWICSRDTNKKDGYGRNIYVENVLEASMYIRAIDNTTISSSVMPKSQLTPLPLGGGSDGDPVTDGSMLKALDTLSNIDEVMLTVVMDGGWATPAYQKQGIIALCELREDCIGELSTPFYLEESTNYMNEIINYRKLVLNANTWTCAMYTPHVKIYDKFNNREIFVSPDGYAAAQLSETASNYEMWYPVAGFKRGMLNVVDLHRRFTATRAGGGEIGLLYDEGVNPLRFYPGKGIMIWGQKTLSARPSALDRLNVACLLIVIRPAISESLEDKLFDLGLVSTRKLVESMIKSYMEDILARNGVYEFRVVCDDTNNTAEDLDNYRMNVDLYVKPSKSIEEINFKTVIARTGDSLEALTSVA